MHNCNDRERTWMQCYRFFVLTACAIAIAVVGTLSGCSNSEQVAAESEPETKTVEPMVDTQATKTTTVAVDRNGVPDRSPAEVKVKLPSSTTPPEQICKMFVEYLSSGNRTMAEQLLTPAALTITSRAELQLEPVAGPQAEYDLSSPRYATNKQKICQVDCKINDTLDGKPVTSEITWLCRRQKSGWRIAGMMVAESPDSPKNLLSFESEIDVAQIKGSLIDDLSVEFRNASTDDQTRRLK